MKAWTKTKLKHRCFKLLQRQTTTVKLAVWNKRHQYEFVTWDEKSIDIRVDTHQAGLIVSVIHALTHVAMEIPVRHAKVDDNLEEGSVKNWSEEIWNDVSFSPTQMRRWRKAVNARMR